jgi:acyl carrier protein
MSTIERSISRFIADEILRESSPEKLWPERMLLEDGVLDSLGLQSLMAFLEKEFAVTLSDDELVPENFESIRAIARLVSVMRESAVHS